ncbi:MAG: phosphopyruvate hydratase, partial [Clostridia bacterium]|nr:phosphopyruvate hydratase [Clostridia bacterium]
KNVLDQQRIDDTMIQLDGTADKSNLGANTLLAVSIAAVRAGAAYVGLPLYRYMGGISGRRMPIPMMNVLNGGVHAGNNLDIQEFMLVPVGASSFHEGLRWGCEVYGMLRKILKEKGLSVSLGDEGGFAPDLKNDEEAIELLLSAVELAGYKAGHEIMLALDVAAAEWQDGDNYRMPKRGVVYSSGELVKHWINLCARYPICSLEDPLGEDDWNGWKKLTGELGHIGQYQLVGDDLFVTNAERLRVGGENGCGNAILIKPNQIGTVSETLKTVRLAQQFGYRVVVSHRSGDTEDSFIADLAVSVNAPFMKSGAPARSERLAKYNRLCWIEEDLNGLSW